MEQGLGGIQETLMAAHTLTELLNAASRNEPGAVDRLVPLLYDELRHLAAAQMAREKPGQTFDATGLVHEAYLRLFDTPHGHAFDNRRHFFAAAAQAMRHILVDNARRKQSLKRGGAARRVAESPELAGPDADARLLALDEALTRLAVENPLAARVVELHQFAGLGHDRVAETLGLTVYRAREKWNYARAWLKAAVADF